MGLRSKQEKNEEKQSLMDLHDTMEQTNMCIMREGNETEKGTGILFEDIRGKIFSNVMKHMNLQIQDVQRNPVR